ncbi:amino acid ABC transporter permease [Paradevosia shaoguanensis]|jgi:general L-amino acid transport system permease protein|uniref:amino acid ABC transporter permease n=1 Tax=Paradevosia shaoguanensis TaxID=1335043 RepID=UPI001ED0219A|nr:amino acid ABC transporter permease [Devosia nanyangense]
MSDAIFVRSEILTPQRPPARGLGAWDWARKHLFSSPSDVALTVVAVAFVLWVIPGLYNFFIGNAVFSDPEGLKGAACRFENVGACWIYIADRFDFFMFGFYPAEEYWRPTLVFALTAVLLIPLLWPGLPFKRTNALLFFIVLPVVSFYLLMGGAFGLPIVTTEKWGGLMITLIISIVGITCSIPIGILLALGRQSKLPIIKTLCVCFIELWRAVPLITVLFMASVMLPLFLPVGMTFDKLLRALVGVTLFASAYLAETVRGGLQAIPRGQTEAASALGLSYWKRMGLIILPQALKHVIPGIVNNFIALFKDTSLVYIVGLFDLLRAVQSSTSLTEWASPTQAVTGYVFAAFVFWMFCFSISRYSQYMERRLDTGHKR